MEQLLHNSTFDITLLIGILTPLLTYVFNIFIKMSPKRATYASRFVVLFVIAGIKLIRHWHSRTGHVHENVGIISREVNLLKKKLKTGQVILG